MSSEQLFKGKEFQHLLSWQNMRRPPGHIETIFHFKVEFENTKHSKTYPEIMQEK